MRTTTAMTTGSAINAAEMWEKGCPTAATNTQAHYQLFCHTTLHVSMWIWVRAEVLQGGGLKDDTQQHVLAEVNYVIRIWGIEVV